MILIAPRGVFISHQSPVLLDQAVKALVQKNLEIGNSIRLSARDLIRMYETGNYLIPQRIDDNNTLSLHAYCCGILHDLETNHGSTKKEALGYGMVYEFHPDTLQKVKV